MEILVLKLGVVSFAEGLATQRRIHGEVVTGERAPTLILCEHTPTITTGNREGARDLKIAETELQRLGIAFETTDRGGKLTAHEPGQLVIYPIVPVEPMGVRKFVQFWENATRATLERMGVASQVDCDHPGVWVGSSKIAAVGLRIRDRVSMHGLAINVHNDLETFSYIVPCGLADKGVTSLSRELRRGVTTDEVETNFLAVLRERGSEIGL